MNTPLPTDLNAATIASHLDFSNMGPGFPSLLAALPGLSDAALAALPPEWAALPGLIVTLIEDEGMSSEMAAHAANTPVSVVRDYRALVGI